MRLIYGEHSACVFIPQWQDEKVHKHRYPIRPGSYRPLTYEGGWSVYVCVCNSIWSLTWMPLSVSPLSALHLARGYEPETSLEPHPTPSPRNPSHPPHSYQKRRNRQKMGKRECVLKKQGIKQTYKMKAHMAPRPGPAMRSVDIWGLAQTSVELFGDILWWNTGISLTSE